MGWITGERFDIPGSLVYGLTLVTIMYGMSVLPEKEALYLISIGILGILAFVILETRTDAPVLDMNLFKRNVVFAFSNLAALINYTTVALFTFAFLEDTTGIQFVVARLAFLGAGLAFFSSPNTNAIMSSVGKKFYGIGSAMVATMRLLGQMTSMGIAMVVIAVYMGKVEITPGYYVMFLKS